MTSSGLERLAECIAGWAAILEICAIVNGSLPLMPILTFPYYNLAAAVHKVMCSALVLATELGSDGRSFDGKRAVLTNTFLGTEGTSCAV